MTRLQLQAAPQRSCSAGSRRTKAGGRSRRPWQGRSGRSHGSCHFGVRSVMRRVDSQQMIHSDTHTLGHRHHQGTDGGRLHHHQQAPGSSQFVVMGRRRASSLGRALSKTFRPSRLRAVAQCSLLPAPGTDEDLTIPDVHPCAVSRPSQYEVSHWTTGLAPNSLNNFIRGGSLPLWALTSARQPQVPLTHPKSSTDRGKAPGPTAVAPVPGAHHQELLTR